MRHAEIPIEVKRQLEFPDRVLKAARRKVDTAESRVGPRIVARDVDRLERGTLRRRRRGREIFPTEMYGTHVARGEHGKSLAIVRIERDRPLQERLRGQMILLRDLPEMRQRAHYQIPRIQIVRRLAPGV